MKVFKRIGLILWKNILFRKRHYVVTAMEILLPVLFTAALALVKSLTDVANIITTDTIYPEAHLNELDFLLLKKTKCDNCVIAYTPVNTEVDDLIAKLRLRLPGIKFKGLASEMLIEQSIMEPGTSTIGDLKAAIIFPNELKNLLGEVPYKIRIVDPKINTARLFPRRQLPGPVKENLIVYALSGFSALQMHLDHVLLELMTGKTFTHNITLQPFPYPPHITDFNYVVFYFSFVPQFLCLGFIFIVPSITRGVVSEKETGIKELMKMMGMSNWMSWLGWFINSIGVLLISVTFVVIFLFAEFNKKTGAVLSYSDPTVWWVTLFLFAMASTTFCFFISSFFSTPSIAITFGTVAYIVCYYAFALPLEQTYESLSIHDKLFVALVPNMCLYWSIKIMDEKELKAVGAKWSNINEPLSSEDNLKLTYLYAMFIVDTVMYMLLTLYVESILPSEYGVRKPWNFIFKPSTWWCASGKVKPTLPASAVTTNVIKPGFEEEPSDLIAGVEIQNLRKVFGKNKVAVDGVSMKMYDGEITALLGHNGAGKTTTMSMLTGLFAPTSGTVFINGRDINTDIEGVRESLGLCPQHNMLFGSLTVAEHLLFFGRLRGLTSSEASKQAKELIDKLNMTQKANVLAEALSGGQKRRLCLSMALIGGSKVVVLDEPTSGLDPEARRQVWNLLLELRGERTILLTTHFMEEADVLGDRIAIMAGGKIKCSGTPMFLKKFYGAGYTLSMTTNDKAQLESILLTVQKYVSTAFYKSESANPLELSIILPTETVSTSKFPEMFSDLSNNKGRLGIETIGLSLTTMDEVFVKVGELGHAPNPAMPDYKESTITNITVNQASPEYETKKASTDDNSVSYGRIGGLALARQQFWALLIKRCIYTFRKRRLVLSQLLIPVISLICAIQIANLLLKPKAVPPPLLISIKPYNSPITLFKSTDKDLSDAFKNVVGSSAKLVDPTSSKTVADGLIKAGRRDLGAYREHYIVAAEMEEMKMKAMFSSNAYHASPLALNCITNSLLNKHDSSGKKSIAVINHPLQGGEDSRFDPFTLLRIPLIFVVFYPLGLALLSASYIIFPVEERLSQGKQLQMMTGVSPLVYWSSSYLWDVFVMIVLISIMILDFPIFQNYYLFTSYGGIGVAFLILLIYGLAAIPFSYLCSLFVASEPGGFAMITTIHCTSGMLMCLVVHLMEISKVTSVANVIRIVGRIFPTFGAAISTLRYVEIAIRNSRCNSMSEAVKKIVCHPSMENAAPKLRQCCANCLKFKKTDIPKCFEPEKFIKWTYNKAIVKIKVGYVTTEYLEVPGIGREILYMSIMGLVYMILLMLLEYGIFKKLIALVHKSKPSSFQACPSDEDVVEEANRVENLIKEEKNEDALLVNNLCKSYGSFAAVSNLSFGVHHGECFGLLGVNGAGKTTTFRMLTGDEIRSNGNAYGFMCNLEENSKEFCQSIGYCPQFDAIIGVLSGKEMLQLFARLRGVHPKAINQETEKWLSKLGLTESGNAQCGKYSGGMKRRLSAGMAMIGDPLIILLDEPTSGVDPISRRQFWKIILSIKDAGQAIILTSHSMEECEALCSRLGIMVNGQLQCLGGVQHLKNKFAQDYTLTLKLKPMIASDSERLKGLIDEFVVLFSPCILKDQHLNVLKYQLLDTAIPWNVLFQSMENLKNQYEDLIEDYSVCETTLEEIFLSFARNQYPNRHANISTLKKIMTCQCLN